MMFETMMMIEILMMIACLVKAEQKTENPSFPKAGLESGTVTTRIEQKARIPPLPRSMKSLCHSLIGGSVCFRFIVHITNKYINKNKEINIMKKIINSRKYDTETATLLVTGENPYRYDPINFNYYEESLYLKKTGEFFLYGKGNGLSPYASTSSCGYTFGEKIIPLTEEEAMEWAESNITVDEFEEIFGDVEE